MLVTRRLSHRADHAVRRHCAGVTLATAILIACTLLVFWTPAAEAATRRGVMHAAARYAAAHGYRVGIAVLDTRTGIVHTAGHADATFVSASVVKVLVAARLLVSGRMHGNVEKLAYKMITQSDNAATDELYPMAGGDSLEPWIARHYHVHLGAPTAQPGAWGLTRLIPRGLVHLYAKLKADPAVGPWLLRAMHHIHKYSAAGEYQWWGLPSATPGAAVKQGWNTAYGNANVNTTGFVNGDRYAVAILTRGPLSSYLTPISTAVTHIARLLLPHGHFPDGMPAITGLSRRHATTAGGAEIVVHGRAFTNVRRVLFSGSPGRHVTVTSRTRLTVLVPVHAAGWVNVRVVTSHGTTPRTATDRFDFVTP